MTIKKNLDKILFDKIKDSLISGEYFPGQKIYIDELADKYGVSRTPVIQAVKLLADKHILNIGSNGRVVVPEYDEKQIRDICSARIHLEKYAIDFICEKKDRKLLSEMRKAAGDCHRYFEKGEYVKSCKADMEMHKILVESTGNQCIIDIYKMVQGQFLITSYSTMTSKERSQTKATKDHCDFLDALEAFDAQKANRLNRKHILDVCDQILKVSRMRKTD
jgi:DNA-binding GntR family transcriptional regulator